MFKKGKKKRWPKEAVAAVIFVVFCILLIGAAVSLELKEQSPNMGKLWQNIILSILCSIAASIIFVLLQEAFSRNEHTALAEQLETIEAALRHQSELYDSGIISIRPKSYFDGEDDFWKDIIKNTETRLDLIGHSLSKWFLPEYKEHFQNKVKGIVESGKEVRIVLSAENYNLDHAKLAFLGKLDDKLLSKPEKTILQLIRLIHTIDPEKRKNLKVYVANPLKVTYMYIRTDHQSIISPYIFSPTNNQNTFLLELQPDTKYAKAFEDDFREMIEGLDCLDLLKKEGLGIRQIKCVACENQYSGHDWNHEKTKKYLYTDGNITCEVGYFEHYMDDRFVKAVIELPVSYGCPSKCKFCASSAIQEFQPLTAEQMMTLFEELYATHNCASQTSVLVSLTGMGDIYFNPDNVAAFLRKLAAYKNLQVTLSSCLWNQALLKKISLLEECPPIRKIQITYVSEKVDTLNRVMPIYADRMPAFSEIVAFIKASNEQYFRINYILIKDINDTEEDFYRLKERLSGISDKVIVRISQLNETIATQRNGLSPADPNKAQQLRDFLSKYNIKSYPFGSEKNDNMNCGQLLIEKEVAT